MNLLKRRKSEEIANKAVRAGNMADERGSNNHTAGETEITAKEDERRVLYSSDELVEELAGNDIEEEGDPSQNNSTHVKSD